ncbi:hypothetical protein SDC9_116021 [bioreactor metagenome]|uniref:Uncharacterized protein n=1 Tax=bioreactor metagenome TaxID=1076179 RepID=A0A645BV61_9ZZZZ
MARNRDNWEDPEIMEWSDDSVRSDDRCLPGIALITAVGAFAFCRPRYYGCRPRYYYGYGCRPSYYYGYDYFPYRMCYPRPCRPL